MQFAELFQFEAALNAEVSKQAKRKFVDPLNYYYGNDMALKAIKKAVRQVLGRRNSISGAAAPMVTYEDITASNFENLNGKQTVVSPVATNDSCEEKTNVSVSATECYSAGGVESRYNTTTRWSVDDQLYRPTDMEEARSIVNIDYEEGSIIQLLSDFEDFLKQRDKTIFDASLDLVHLQVFLFLFFPVPRIFLHILIFSGIAIIHQIEYHKVAGNAWRELLTKVSDWEPDVQLNDGDHSTTAGFKTDVAQSTSRTAVKTENSSVDHDTRLTSVGSIASDSEWRGAILRSSEEG